MTLAHERKEKGTFGAGDNIAQSDLRRWVEVYKAAGRAALDKLR